MNNVAGDYASSPFIVIWEPTRACDLACFHCRAAAQPLRSAFELSTADAFSLIDQIAELGPRIFVLTGGDPLKRPDLYGLITYSVSKGLEPSITPSATPLLDDEAVARLKASGVSRFGVSLDHSTAELHDAFRGVPGSYNLTISAIRSARALDLPVQINTTVTRRNIDDLEALADVLSSLDIAMWSVFFLVPTGRGRAEEMITAADCERVFEILYRTSRRVSFDVKTTEGMHYRRYVMQRRLEEMNREVRDFTNDRGLLQFEIPVARGLRAPRGVNDAKGFVFVSHTGNVYPSGFFPLSAGNVRKTPLAEIYRESPLFTSLRDSSLLKGKCGACEFREICGGSRARSYAMTGDPHAADPLCEYVPEAWRERSVQHIR